MVLAVFRHSIHFTCFLSKTLLAVGIIKALIFLTFKVSLALKEMDSSRVDQVFCVAARSEAALDFFGLVGLSSRHFQFLLLLLWWGGVSHSFWGVVL